MRESYTRTFFHKDLKECKVKLILTEYPKWEQPNEGHEIEVEYKGLVQWDIISGIDAEEIESMTDANSVDEAHEYLVLHFEDGTTSTYRNSHTIMFII